MKTLILIFFTMTVFTQAFAGILENRSTGETIEFTLDRSTQEIDIYSTSSNTKNKSIKLYNLSQDKSQQDLLLLTNWSLCKYDYKSRDGYQKQEGDGDCYLIDDGKPILLPITFSLDILSMPIRLPLKVFDHLKLKKDFRKLMRSINSTDTVIVSDKRFRRIENLLK